MSPLPQSALGWSLLLALAYLFALAVTAIAAALRAGGRREETIAPDDTRAVSRFTIPVSLIVTARPADDDTSRTIAALLDLNYPELEVIAVVDGQDARAVETLTRDWQLEAHEFFFRRSIDTAPVRRMYRSGRDSRLTVVDQRSASRADAVNCGINIARYRYIAAVSPGITFDRNALLRVMAAPLLDPSTIVGASAHLERTGLFSRIASARSLTASLLLWRHMPCAPGPADAVSVWRRDAVLEAGGFSKLAADPDLDMTRRIVLERKGASDCRFYRSGELFGQCAGRKSGVLSRQLSAIRFLSVLTPRGLRAFGSGSLAAFFAVEVLGPVAQAWVIVGTVIGALSGAWGWSAVLMAIALLSIGRAAVTTAALLTRGSAVMAPEGRSMKALLAVAPFELIAARFLR